MGNAAIPSCAAEVKAWSANGERLAAGCDDGKVHILRSGDREWGKGIGEKPQTFGNVGTYELCQRVVPTLKTLKRSLLQPGLGTKLQDVASAAPCVCMYNCITV